MFCPNCGKEHLSDNGDICMYCGYEFNEIEFSLDKSVQPVISEKIPSKIEKVKMSESAISKEVSDSSVLLASAKIEETVKKSDSQLNIANISADNELPDLYEASIPEEIPNVGAEDDKLPDYTISEEIPDIEELVVEADKEIKEVSEAANIAANENNAENDEPMPNSVFFESSVLEEIPDSNEVNENINKNPFDESYAKAKASIVGKDIVKPAIPQTETAKKEQDKPLSDNKPAKKNKSSRFLLIIILLCIGCALVYFGIHYIQTGNNIFSGSTEKPQTTATQVSVKSGAYSANIVETAINGKTYYSLIVNGEKGSVITVNDKNSYNLAGISISIPINVSDYITSPSQTEASISIKVKIVGPDKSETKIDVPPYNVKIQPANDSTAPTK